jgi:ATP-dependent DNA ligase
VRAYAVDRLPAGSDWLHEVKHDGFHILARKLGERAKVWSGRGADFTGRFSGIAEPVHGLFADRGLVDGGAIVPRDDERSDFGAPAVWSGYRRRRLRTQPPFTVRAIRCAVDDGRARSRRTVEGRSSSSGGERSPRSDP